MKLNKLIIKNFRNYAGEHTFELDKDMIIIYGENGFGKSSFFDAIEWCLTGTISRFKSSNLEKSVVANYNISEFGGECSVKLFFSDNTYLIRCFKKEVEKFTNTLVKLTNSVTNEIISQGEDEVRKHFAYSVNEDGSEVSYNEAMNRLMKKAYLLSQDQILDFIIKDSPKDRFDSLVSIMNLKSIFDINGILKSCNKKLNERQLKYEDELKTINKNIQNISKEKHFIDEKRLHTIFTTLDISPDIEYGELKQLLRRLKDTFTTKSFEYNKLINILDSLINNKFSNLRDIEGKRKNLEDIGRECNKEFLENKMIIGETERKIVDLEKRRNETNSNKKLLFKKRDLEEKLKDIENKLKELNIDANVDETQYRTEVARIGEILGNERLKYSYMKDYEKLDKEKEGLLEKLNNLYLNRQKVIDKCNEIRKDIEVISKVLDNQEESKSISNLLSSLISIDKYLHSHDLNGICPTCSSFIGDDLSKKINENIQRLEDNLSQVSVNISKKYGEKSELEVKLNLNEKHLNTINKEVKSLENSKVMVENQIKHLLPEKMLLDNKKEDSIDKSLELISSLEYKLTVGERALRFIKQRDEIIKQLSDFNKLHIDISGVKDLDEEIAQAIINGEMLLKEKKHENEELDKKNKQITEELSDLRYKLSFLSDMSNSIDFREEFMDIAINIEADIKKYDFLKKAAYELEDLIEKIDNNLKMDNIKNTYELRKDLVENKIDYILQKHNEMNNVINKIFEKYGEGIETFLNKPNSSINKYYNYLNPLPVNNIIKFDICEDKLDILVETDQLANSKDEKLNAKHVMSSGQLSILALSIFLATNESEQIGKLDFVAIDDPIQNMDDVNSYTVCDVLSNLNKQVIISTHDLDFLKLLIMKNSSRKDKIALYKLDNSSILDNRITKIDISN